MSKYVKNHKKEAVELLDRLNTKTGLKRKLKKLTTPVLEEIMISLIGTLRYDYVDIVVDELTNRDANLMRPRILPYYNLFLNYLELKEKAFEFWDKIDDKVKKSFLYEMKESDIFEIDLNDVEEYHIITIWNYIN